MIELIILEYLNKHSQIPAYMEKPNKAPPKYYLIEKLSGGASNHIGSASFSVQSYASSLYEAAELNEKVIETLLSAVELDEIVSVKLDTNYNFTDSTTKRYRYQAIFDVVHY